MVIRVEVFGADPRKINPFPLQVFGNRFERRPLGVMISERCGQFFHGVPTDKKIDLVFPSAKLERMKVIRIPKSLSQEGDLVLIPRREYEKLLQLKKIREFRPTANQKDALKRAERNLKRGKTLSYDAVARALGLAD